MPESLTKESKVKQKSRLEILYNGRTEEFKDRPKELVGALLEESLARFGVVQNPHLMSLFDSRGNELDDASTLKDAKVRPGDELVLRQSKVKGG